MGVFFDGIKKLPAEHLGMKKELLLQWMAESQFLEKANVRLNDAAMLGEVTQISQMTHFFCSSSITPHDFLVKIG